MKPSIAFLPLLFAFSLASPTPASVTNETPPPAVLARVDVRMRFGAMIDELAAKAVARSATREDWQRVVDEMCAIANEYMDNQRVAGIRERAVERMNELELRAKEAQLMLMEFDVFKDLIIDLDLQGIFQRTIDRARVGDVTRLQWTMYETALQERANAAKAWNPEIDAILGRLMTECQNLEKRAGEALAPKDLATVVSLQADMMVGATAARLSRRALEPIPGIRDPHKRFPLSKYDFSDVTTALIAEGTTADAEFMKKVEIRLAEIRDAAASGRITRVECDALCTLLLQRARAAVKG